MLRSIFIGSLLAWLCFVQSVPLSSNEENDSIEDGDNVTKTSVNGSGPDLIVIKTYVYEIGILTDDGNNTNGSNDTQEEINLTFFDPENNGSFIDLSNIPVPFQTNISGITVTGVAPANFGAIKLDEDGTPTLNGSSVPFIPHKQVKVSHNITTINQHDSALLLDNLSNVLGLKKNKTKDRNDNEKSSTSTTTTTEASSSSFLTDASSEIVA